MSESQEFGPEFTNAYTSLLITVWTDEAAAAQLAADPTAYATEKGLPVAEGSIVRVDDSPHDGLFTLEEVTAGWTATPGVHILYVPATPVVDLNELDEADLDAIAAGDNSNNINVSGLCLKVG
jgi:hypothetical protein